MTLLSVARLFVKFQPNDHAYKAVPNPEPRRHTIINSSLSSLKFSNMVSFEFSIAIGLIFGKAALLEPVEALR